MARRPKKTLPPKTPPGIGHRDQAGQGISNAQQGFVLSHSKWQVLTGLHGLEALHVNRGRSL